VVVFESGSTGVDAVEQVVLKGVAKGLFHLPE
jgi:hypothetical protein